MEGKPAPSPSCADRVSSSLLGESRGLRNIAFRSRRGDAQPSFPRRPALQKAGAGGEKTARPKRASGSLRRGLARDQGSHPRPSGGRDETPDHGRFAEGKPGKDRHRQVRRSACSHRSAQPARAAPPAIQPRPRGTGCRQGVALRDAIQPRRLALESLRGREGLSFRRASRRTRLQPARLVWEGLEGATRPSMPMRQASTGFAIGWGCAPGRSRANLGTAGGEFA